MARGTISLGLDAGDSHSHSHSLALGLDRIDSHSRAGLLSLGISSLPVPVQRANVDVDDGDGDSAERAFPHIPGREGYSTVNIGDGMEACPTAAACIRVLRDSAAGLGYEVVRRGPYGQRPREMHWGEALMHNPNPAMTGRQYWRWMFGELWARGEAFSWIERDRYSNPIGIWPARISAPGWSPPAISYGRTVGQPEVWVMVPEPTGFGAGYNRTIKTMPSDVLHFTDESYDPFRGRARNPLACKARNPIGIYKLVVGRYLSLLVRGGHADRYIETDDIGYLNYLKAREQRDLGTENATDVLPIPLGSRLHEAGRSALEMQTVEVLDWLDPRIAMSWGVPLFALGIEKQGGRGIRQDLREQYQQFLRSGFETQLKIVEEEFNRKVLGTARGFRCRFRVEDLTIGTLEQRASVVNILVQRTGVLTPNEGREIMGKPPLLDPAADELRAATGAPAPQGAGAKPAPKKDAADANAGELPSGQSWMDFDPATIDTSNPATIAEIRAELAMWESECGIQ